MNTLQHRTESQKTSRSAPYTEAQVRRWLSFLARNMQQHEQTVFLIEQLQPTWLTTRWQSEFYIPISQLIWVGVVFGLVGLLFGLVGLLFGLIVVLWNKRSRQIRTVETMRWSWSSFRRNGRKGLLAALLVAPLFGILATLLARLLGMLFLPIYWLSVGVLGFLLIEWVDERLFPEMFFELLGPDLLIGLLLGLFGLLGGLIYGLLGGLTPGIREINTGPNQGIWLTIRYSFSIGSIVGLIIGLIGWWLSDRSAGAVAVLGVFGGLLAGFLYGGFDVLQHCIIRLLFWLRGDAPLNYARFLDYAATDLHFLQKVGGGYIFVHRYLLEHFAAMAEEGK